MKRFIILLTLAFSILFGGASAMFMPQAAFAACDPTTNIQLSSPLLSGKDCIPKDGSNGGPIMLYLVMVIQYFSSAIVIVIVLMLVIGGIQYITSAGSPGAVKAARDRITNAIIGLILFMLMFAVLNFLIPGGIFR
jgi:hypothetical protein